MEFDAFSGSDVSQNLIPCGICGRNFNSSALERHQPICAKAGQKRRKVFDTSKQRAEGTEIASVKKTFTSNARRPAAQAGVPGKKNNWRSKHEDFINTIRAARGVQKCIDSGAPLPPPPPPTINPDYVQCPHCSRRFNETAAERHVNFCKEQHSRLPTKKPDATASAKQNARKQYQAPRLAKKSSPGSATQKYADYNSNQGTTRNTPGMRTTGAAKSNNAYSASRYADSGVESPSSGRALRTGRTAEGYSDARELSAKQRSNMPRKTPVKSQYNGYGGAPSATSTFARGAGAHGDNGYYSADSEPIHAPSRQPPPQSIVKGRISSGGGASKFCHDCGSRYPVAAAKFCCECGIRRVSTN